VSIEVRRLVARDIENVVPIIAAAYGHHDVRTAERLAHALLRPTHVALFAAIDGVPAGTVYAELFGSVAYVGGMAVDPSRQRRGVGAALMRVLVGEIDCAHVATTLLDATESGAPLYRQIAFEDDGEVAVWEHPVTGPSRTGGGTSSITSEDLNDIAAFDGGIFGADRSGIVREAAGEAPGRIALDRRGDGTIPRSPSRAT